MKKLSKEFIIKLHEYIKVGYITRRFHNTLNISILKYSRDGQLACNSKSIPQEWDDVMMACRGLVIDNEYNIIAEPFSKFFNYEQLSSKDILVHKNEKYVIQEKVDGSLIICFNYRNEWILATQKSFYSDIALIAQKDFNNKHNLNLNKDYIYLLEYTSPLNRVVVNYGNESKFTLLATKNSKNDFEEINLDIESGFELVKEFHNLKLNELSSLNWENSEGFVVKFDSGFRYKIKFENYLTLHYILTGISAKEIFKLLSDKEDDQALNKILQNTPDEFDSWVENIKNIYLEWYSEKENELKSDFAFLDIYLCSNQNATKKEVFDFLMEYQKKGMIKNGNYVVSTYNKERFPKYNKYLWKYVDKKRLEAQKEVGLLPVSYFKEPSFEF